MNLPELIGFNDKHISLREQFISRLIALLKDKEIRMSSYGISEDYLGQPCESVKLETDFCILNLQMTARRGS